MPEADNFWEGCENVSSLITTGNVDKDIGSSSLLEILRISLIETKTESNPNRVQNPRETSISL